MIRPILTIALGIVLAKAIQLGLTVALLFALHIFGGN